MCDVCVCVCVCEFVCMCMCVNVRECVCVCERVHRRVCVCLCMHVRGLVWGKEKLVFVFVSLNDVYNSKVFLSLNMSAQHSW